MNRPSLSSDTSNLRRLFIARFVPALNLLMTSSHNYFRLVGGSLNSHWWVLWLGRTTVARLEHFWPQNTLKGLIDWFVSPLQKSVGDTFYGKNYSAICILCINSKSMASEFFSYNWKPLEQIFFEENAWSIFGHYFFRRMCLWPPYQPSSS